MKTATTDTYQDDIDAFIATRGDIGIAAQEQAEQDRADDSDDEQDGNVVAPSTGDAAPSSDD